MKVFIILLAAASTLAAPQGNFIDDIINHRIFSWVHHYFSILNHRRFAFIYGQWIFQNKCAWDVRYVWKWSYPRNGSGTIFQKPLQFHRSIEESTRLIRCCDRMLEQSRGQNAHHSFIRPQQKISNFCGRFQWARYSWWESLCNPNWYII